MKRLMFYLLMILCSAAVSDAEVYTWTNDQGGGTFTDNPALIPSHFSSRSQSGDIVTIHPPQLRKAPGTQGRRLGRKHIQAIIPGNRVRSIVAAQSRQKQLSQPAPAQLPLDMQSEIKGHLGGDQTDPAPPSMKQPKPLPMGDQPQVTSPGMKQPKPVPLGDQPPPTSSGMKQPKSETTGDQPPPTSSGMEQPDSKR